MKTYKDFGKRYIGGSDFASLTLRSPKKAGILNFDEDGDYYAYIVTENIEIPPHYELSDYYLDWLTIYDDEGLTCTFAGKTINVYRAGMMGCIIQILN